MTPRLDAIEIVVADMAAALDFYRRLGLDVPDGAEAEPHVEVTLPGGLRLMFDTQDTIRPFDPSWTPPTGGPAMALAFDCGDAGRRRRRPRRRSSPPATAATSRRGTRSGVSATRRSSTPTATRSTCSPPCRRHRG